MQCIDDFDCGLDLSLNINTPILQFFKEKPIIPSFHDHHHPLKKLHKSHKSSYQNIPLIQEPSECDSFRETFGKISPKSGLLRCIFTHDYNFLEKILKEQTLLAINEADLQGNSPLMLAVKLAYRHLDYYKIIRVLLEKGANPSFRDQKGFSILEEALAQVIFRKWLFFLSKSWFFFIIFYSLFFTQISEKRLSFST